jgi:ABC-type multidrug transport system fused ATPase/permease subunit
MKARKRRLDALVTRILDDLESYEGSMMADLKRLWRNYLAPQRGRIIAALLITFGWSVFPYVTAMLTRFLVDKVLLIDGEYDPSMFSEQLPLFIRYVVILFTAWGLYVFANWSRNRLIIDTGQKLIYELRKELHEKLQNLHVGYFETHESGKIVSRVLDDVKNIRNWATVNFLDFASQVFRLLIGVVLIFFINWKLSLIIVFVLPIYAYIYARMRPNIRRNSISIRRMNSQMYALSSERISGISVVKAFTKEQGEFHRFANLLNNSVRLALRAILYRQQLTFIAGLITAVVKGLVIYLGVLFVKSDVMSFGDVMAFIQIMPNLFMHVNALTAYMTQIEGIFVVIRRVFYLLDEVEDVIPGHINLDGMTGKIDFEDVTFMYPGQEKPALANVKFHIDPGERVALMGPSGSGKSTIFQLLCRFYDPQDGVVRVGGVNLVDANPSSVRHHVRMVQQEPVVFSGTIGDNIAYGDLDATPTMIMTATTQAELHEFVMSLPVKYETEVGRNGVALSGGQKQRLALSTALLTEPEVLLLDDTTSALDAETERRIRETLNKVLQGRTSIIITQRIATARSCDKILVFEDGRITQVGNHDELRNSEGFYKRILEQQESI